MSFRSAALRRRVHEVLEVARPGDTTSLVVDYVLIVLVATNVAAVVFASVQSLYGAYRGLFQGFEAFSVAIFTLEYGLRVWAASEPALAAGNSPWRGRTRYVLSPMAVADLLAIMPFYLSALFALDLRFLRVLRLARIFKLTRYSGAMNTVLQALASERRAIGAALFILLVVMIFAASGIYLVEHRAQPEAFGSIPAAMWWAVAALTTVGYGDVTPVTVIGKIFASLITIGGIGMVALPTGVLASAFSEVHQRNRRRLELEADNALADGVFSDDDARAYSSLAEKLGVAPEVAQEIVAAAWREGADTGHDACPHCGKALD